MMKIKNYPMYKVVFYYPTSEKENKGTEFLYSPLALAYLSTHTPDYYDRELYDEYVGEDLDPTTLDADIVAMSPLTSGINRAYWAADILRKRGIICVVGGAHVSALPEEACEHFDSVIIGEGEGPWRQFLQDFESNAIRKTYFGRMDVPLHDLGIPDRNMMHPKYHYSSVNTSRGCPYNCSFCYLTVYQNRRYRTIPHNIILEDLERLRNEFLVIFTDENFIGYSKRDNEDRKELLRKMIEQKYNFIWGCQVSLNIADDPELMDLMYRAGCRGVFIGFETSNPEDLKAIRKSHNQNTDYRKIVKKIHKHKLAVIASCILGLDNQHNDYHKQLIRDLKTMNVEFVRVFLMTSWPGTPLNDKLREEGRLIEDWDRTRKDIPNIHYKHYTHEEIIAARKEIMDSFFNFFNIFKIIIRRMLINRSLIFVLIKMSFRNRVSEKIRTRRAFLHASKKNNLNKKETAA
jgi:radical SAM superfamily enzyme YgiQ (UPF0313 family)